MQNFFAKYQKPINVLIFLFLLLLLIDGSPFFFFWTAFLISAYSMPWLTEKIFNYKINQKIATLLSLPLAYLVMKSIDIIV